MKCLLLTAAVITFLCAAGSAHATSASIPASGQVVFLGDSLSGDAPWKYPAQFAGLLGAGWTWDTVAVSGASSAAMLATVPLAVAAFDENAEAHVASVWAGTNDGTGIGLASYANIVAACRALRSAGYSVLVLSVLPRTDSYAAAWGEAWRSGQRVLNAQLRSNWRTFANYFADVGADARLADPAMYTDGAHLCEAGYGIVAQDAREALLYPARSMRRGRGYHAILHSAS